MGKSSINGKNICHKKSGHAAPGPPAVNGVLPPTTPSGQPLTPVPFVYIAKTSTIQDTSASRKTNAKGVRLAKKGTVMDVEAPANMPSKPVERAPPNGSDLPSKVAV